MNKVSRILTMVGMGLMAGVTIGAGPAQATGSTSTTTTTAQTQNHFRGDQVVGWYRSAKSCLINAAIGERVSGNDYYCDFVVVGPRRGFYALTVERNWDWHRGHAGNWGHGGGWGHGRGHRHGH